MSTLHISLFGKFCARRDGQILEGFDARKVQELFCYLLLHRDHALSRETLASVLWPETTTALSKKSLRQVLWQLQSALGSQSAAISDRLLVVDAEWIQLNAQADLWLDVAALEYASNVIQNIPGTELDAQRALMLQQAVQLYQGPLLEGWYSGDRAAALRQFDLCSAALEDELGVGPSKHTVALYEQIQADQLTETEFHGTTPPANGTLEAASPLLLEVLGRLEHLQGALTELQTQVQQTVKTVEQIVASNQLSTLAYSTK